MNITTKYEVGQEVYYLSRKTFKIEYAPVYKIEVAIGDVSKTTPAPIAITYYMWHNDSVDTVNEELCNTSKQQLIETL